MYLQKYTKGYYYDIIQNYNNTNYIISTILLMWITYKPNPQIRKNKYD